MSFLFFYLFSSIKSIGSYLPKSTVCVISIKSKGFLKIWGHLLLNPLMAVYLLGAFRNYQLAISPDFNQ